MTTPQEHEDYILVPKRSAKISRARKAVIGVMAIGAVAALTNSGTFASFSASTTNDGKFTTEKLIMSNTPNGGTECLSASAANSIDNSTAGVASNDGACATLFTAAKPADPTQLRTLQITNLGDGAHDITLWNTTPCVGTDRSDTNFASGASSLCTNVRVFIRQVASVGGAGIGSCIYPSAVDCSGANTVDLTASGSSTYTIAALQAAIGSSFATKTPVANALAANTSAFYEVGVYLPHDTTTCGSAPYTFNVNGLSVGAAGVYSSTGVSCDNVFINKKAQLTLKWYMSV